ncbi:GTP cyclohydrolase 1 type 2/Nif3 [Entophlyctis helioformis]|nr:GTP cyclohydrolase 1 type 2/Nif3 [Entophlyctis helioformis]KAI8924251.1 GTP cyclohydrolase 1 type 2/Nif3 [Entophlyctis helioformis]
MAASRTPSLLQRVVRCMDKIAPLSLSEPWDNTGLLIEAPFPRPHANRVFLTIDLTQDVLDEALLDPAVGVIVAYHPPLFRPFKRLVLSDDKQSIALRCAASGISVFSPHTALDSCVGGINDWLSKGLGPGRTAPITLNANPPPGQDGCGVGRMHTLDEAVALDELIRRVKVHLGLKHVRVARSPEQMRAAADAKLVSTIAICAGSGASVLGGVRADVHLTGEMSHHEVLASTSKSTSVILCEHTNTERGYLAQVLKPRLLSLLKVDHGLGVEADLTVDVLVSQCDQDPLVIV